MVSGLASQSSEQGRAWKRDSGQGEQYLQAATPRACEDRLIGQAGACGRDAKPFHDFLWDQIEGAVADKRDGPDPVAHSGLEPRDQPAAALAESTLPELHKISVVEIWRRPPYAFHLLRLVRERGKSFSHHKHIVWRITLRLGRLRTPERPRSNPVGLIRFSRADPSGSSGQDKARIGENRASAIRIIGPHQIYR